MPSLLTLPDVLEGRIPPGRVFATTGMSHIAIQKAQFGSPVTWMEPVNDEQYRG